MIFRMFAWRFRLLAFLGIISLILSGCVTTRVNQNYSGPRQRTAEMEQYYATGRSYLSSSKETIKQTSNYQIERLLIQTDQGEIKIDYYKRPETSDKLIFVFPLLGGSNLIADHFAEYFAERGYETAIVFRNDDFKRPENFEKLEVLLRQGVIRDRIAIDYFEKELGKREFGTFGISRGAINVAITAGVDPRLKYNVMAMGGTDLPSLFRDTTQKRLRKYTDTVVATRGLSRQQFFSFLENTLRTDPKYLAHYMDARNSLMFLSGFDRTVPIKYGIALKKEIGDPKTVFLAADHYTSILYTQIFKLPPKAPFGIFPFDFIESESLDFYRRSFKEGRFDPRNLPFTLLQLPLNLVVDMYNSFTDGVDTGGATPPPD